MVFVGGSGRWLRRPLGILSCRLQVYRIRLGRGCGLWFSGIGTFVRYLTIIASLVDSAICTLLPIAE